MTPDDILAFWFDEIEPSKWFVKDLAFDQVLIDRFSVIHEKARQCELFEWRSSAEGCLAEVIILDQFSRNMFRDTATAFASDSLALALAQVAITSGKDTNLTAEQRTFLYMPFMHSESLQVHDVAVKLFTQNGIQNNLDFEIKHRDIIAQFGRYPHRNTILGRDSSPAELAFLNKPGSSF
jgi:uncharacterized protein (DUF924 family)